MPGGIWPGQAGRMFGGIMLPELPGGLKPRFIWLGEEKLAPCCSRFWFCCCTHCATLDIDVDSLVSLVVGTVLFGPALGCMFAIV